MNPEEYSEEIKRQNELNIIFTDHVIMQNKFKDYMANLHKSNKPIHKKQQITNILIPKIKKYSNKMYHFKRLNLNY